MKTHCEHCNQEFEVDNDLEGQTAECTACGQDFVITKSKVTLKKSYPPVQRRENLQPSQSNTIKLCPACGEQVLAVAQKCKHCGTSFEALSNKKERKKYWNVIAYISIFCILIDILASFGDEKTSSVVVTASTAFWFVACCIVFFALILPKFFTK